MTDTKALHKPSAKESQVQLLQYLKHQSHCQIRDNEKLSSTRQIPAFQGPGSRVQGDQRAKDIGLTSKPTLTGWVVSHQTNCFSICLLHLCHRLLAREIPPSSYPQFQ